ncbi:MAG: hypothetical protein A2516_07940 [Alphaproteobacteria bacterium RIFOXYD12_FULL_60_8]|nr:MAG: hypothetical protein A2516_07940 [Alphaproteobacteria bacterium RIFOXYD12_FULL_60_8]
MMVTQCPCGSGRTFETCCGPLLAGGAAASPEALMRSRYTAFVKGQLQYIEDTHASDVREDFNRSAAESTASSVEWVGLDILRTKDGGKDDETGEVEFTARFKQNGQVSVHHERSTFRRENGRWFYVDGQMNPKSPPVRVEKVGRNDPCPCGSGKKFKKCCGA